MANPSVRPPPQFSSGSVEAWQVSVAWEKLARRTMMRAEGSMTGKITKRVRKVCRYETKKSVSEEGLD